MKFQRKNLPAPFSFPVRLIEFTATESGFENGMGGASNAAGTEEYHYVLFGRQTDDQHPEYSGVYFEFDDQIHGAVDYVNKVVLADGVVEFELKHREKIVVRCGTAESQWREFLSGIHDVFRNDIVQKV